MVADGYRYSLSRCAGRIVSGETRETMMKLDDSLCGCGCYRVAIEGGFSNAVASSIALEYQGERLKGQLTSWSTPILA